MHARLASLSLSRTLPRADNQRLLVCEKIRTELTCRPLHATATRGYLAALGRVDGALCARGDRVILSPPHAFEPWARSLAGRVGTLERPCGAPGAAAEARWVVAFAEVAGVDAAAEGVAAVRDEAEGAAAPCPCSVALPVEDRGVPQGGGGRRCLALGASGPWVPFCGGRDADGHAATWGALGETLLVAKRDRVRALTAFRRALDALPPSSVARTDVLFRCAQLEHTLQGDLVKSEQLYRQALAQHGEGEDPAEVGGRARGKLDADIVAGYAQLLADDGVMQLGRAEVLFRRVLAHAPSHPQALLGYAALLLDSGGSISHAQTMIEQVLLDDAANPQARSAFATFVARVTGDYDMTEGLYQSALAADPTDVVTLVPFAQTSVSCH